MSIFAIEAMIDGSGKALRTHVYPHLLILLPSPCTRGEGQGVRGIALCFNWYFDREFNVYPRFRSVNK